MFRKVCDNFEEAVGVGLLAVMAILAFLNVITRYFIQYSFAFTEEVEVACLVWLTMLGAAAGFRRGIHLGFDLLKMRFPGFGRRVLVPFSLILTFAMVCILIWFSFYQIADEIAFKTTTEALSIPQWWYTLALPVGGLFILIRIIEVIYKEFKSEKG